MKQLMSGVLTVTIFVGMVCAVGAQDAKAPAKEPVVKEAAVAPATAALAYLQTAYNAEANAKACYTAFADKAEKEGYASVAVLFKAAARSKEKLADKHAGMIKQLNAEPVVKAEVPEIKTTKENLEAAAVKEADAQAKMYPELAKLAEADKNVHAERSFKGAAAGAGEFVKFMKLAVSELDAWKAPGKEFAVCQICAFPMMDMTLKQCPICSAPRSKFDIIK